MAATTLDLSLAYRPASVLRRDKGHAAPALVGYRPREGGDPQAAKGDHVVESESGQDRERILADQALMAAIADGDETSFARVVGEVSPRLLRFARSMLSASPAEAEEVVQEALLRLWRNADGWQPQGRITTWLHQVTYRLCVDAIRRRKPSVDIDSVEAELEDETPIPEERLARIDEARTVREAVGQLPERQRIAVILCHFQNLSQMEAASVMGIGEEAYESLLARARRKLRVTLAGSRRSGGE